MSKVGKSEIRVDAFDKVTGRTKYYEDRMPAGALYARIKHSTIAHGFVKSIDKSAAEAIPGVVKVLTCFDVPEHCFPTAGHPWSMDPGHQDVADRNLLNRHVRYYGDDVCAVGNPLGELEFTSTFGHVSALDRLITTEEGGSAINMFQIDAAVNSGNSGGPVYNDQGQVVGVVNAKYSATGVEGIGFAIPANDAVSIANDLITKGYVTGKAYMGVEIDNRYSSMYSQYYNMPVGAYVGGVTSGSCADKAGIEKGDIITKLDGEEITSYTDLKNAISNHSAGDTVEVELYRAGESRTVSLTFDEKGPDDGAQTSGSSQQSTLPGLGN